MDGSGEGGGDEEGCRLPRRRGQRRWRRGAHIDASTESYSSASARTRSVSPPSVPARMPAASATLLRKCASYPGNLTFGEFLPAAVMVVGAHQRECHTTATGWHHHTHRNRKDRHRNCAVQCRRFPIHTLRRRRSAQMPHVWKSSKVLESRKPTAEPLPQQLRLTIRGKHCTRSTHAHTYGRWAARTPLKKRVFQRLSHVAEPRAVLAPL